MIDSAIDPDQEYVYFTGSETLPSTYCILSEKSIMRVYSTSDEYNNIPKLGKKTELQ